jgi:DNA-binding LacI/PurR family transcriptional regulator
VCRRLDEAVEANIPLVVWGNVSRTVQPRYACVGSDNWAGGRLATRHLLGLGRVRIAFMGDLRLPEVNERYAGYVSALAAVGMKADNSLHLPCAFDGMDASMWIGRLLESRVPFDAIFAASDLLAIAAIGAIREAGFSTPRDVAVVGFDDVAMASYSSPTLTTIRQDFKGASRLMVRRVIDQIGGAEITNDKLPVQLIVRQSA